MTVNHVYFHQSCLSPSPNPPSVFPLVDERWKGDGVGNFRNRVKKKIGDTEIWFMLVLSKFSKYYLLN